MTKKLSILGAAVAAALMLGAAGNATAHATSIGYANAGAGAVTVWLGTYNHGGHHLEGSMNLVGVNGTVFASTTNPFTLLTCTGLVGCKPAGLVDGVTNFYATGSVGGSVPLINVDPLIGGGVNHWQGATFSGLSAGDYRFTWAPIPGASAEWSLWNTNMNGIFNLSGAVVNPNPTPEPGSLALVGLAMFGLAAARRRAAA